jgi:hypothetical protein
LKDFLMNTATANIIVVTAVLEGDKIAGTAIDEDIQVPFTAEATEVNQRVFVPEANLVVTGKFRLGRDICSVGICIKSVLAVVCLPVAAPVDVVAPTAPVEDAAPVDVVAPTAPVEDAAPVDVVAPVLSHSMPEETSGSCAAAATKKRKSSTTARSKKKAATELVAA